MLSDSAVAQQVPAYLRLSELTGRIRETLAGVFAHQSHWVLAEVAGYSFHQPSGHHYFELVEKGEQGRGLLAKMRCTAWAGRGAQSIAAFERATGQHFRDGISVLVNVTVQYQPAYGIQLCLNGLDLSHAIGQVELQRRDTLAQLLQLCPDYIRFDGSRYHTRNQGLRHAAVIQRVAVITAENAAGYKDFEHCLRTNRHGYRIVLEPYFSYVQGESNADALCSRLVDIYRSGIAYDAVVLIRGGGSQMDLLIFEQFRLARAVAKFPIPVIAGIGHQINETIVDLMAHTSVKTPSIAAEYILAHNRRFEEGLLLCQRSIALRAQQLLHGAQRAVSRLNLAVINNSRSRLQEEKEAVTDCYRTSVHKSQLLLQRCHSGLLESGNRLQTRPRILTAGWRQSLQQESAQLKTSLRRYYLQQESYLAHYRVLTRAHDPERILKRGYALIYREGALVKDAAFIAPGEEVRIVTANTSLGATVHSNQARDAS